MSNKLYPRCPNCGERQPDKFHFVVKWFFNWSGAWSNAVACDAAK